MWELCEDGAMRVFPSTLDVEEKGSGLKSSSATREFEASQGCMKTPSEESENNGLIQSVFSSFCGTTQESSTRRKAKGIKHGRKLKKYSYTNNEPKIEMARKTQTVLR